MNRVLLLITLLLISSAPALAVRPDEILADPALEARARIISESLRCLVCQNQSIDDSDADLAHDLRILVRAHIKAGDSDQQVKQYIVNRYGEYVLLKPPFKPETFVLWLGPAALLLIAAFSAALFYRRKRETIGLKPLSGDEQRRLDALLQSHPAQENE